MTKPSTFRMTIMFAVAACLSLAFTHQATAQTLVDPQLDIGNPATCPDPTAAPPNGCPFLFGGTEVFGVPSNAVTIFNNGASSSSTASPILLIVGIPNPTGSTAPPSGISVLPGTSGLSGLSGQLGGTNAWGGSWNTTTGQVNPASIPGDGKVYDTIGLNGSSSEQFANWAAADSAVLGITVGSGGNAWDLFVYTITFPSVGGLPQSLAKGTYITVDFNGGTLPLGTFVIASGCAPGNDSTVQCPSGSNIGTTPFTTSGLVDSGPIPEPASMLLVGTGLVAFGSMLRRRKSGKEAA